MKKETISSLSLSCWVTAILATNALPPDCPLTPGVSLFIIHHRCAILIHFLAGSLWGKDNYKGGQGGTYSPNIPLLSGAVWILGPWGMDRQWAGLLEGKGESTLREHSPMHPPCGSSAGRNMFGVVRLLIWLPFCGWGIPRVTCQVKHPLEANSVPCSRFTGGKSHMGLLDISLGHKTELELCN